ncbi:MAG: hypothetical protein SCJ94_10830 [Bacillota bacterium]|nr:hypothetical protein [Bacillota bacterium]MDW7730478.1 hypothetical protein [Bacillota bacterium]
MVLENPNDNYLDNIEEHFVKIFKKSNYQNSEEEINDIDLDSDDSDMKIFYIK